MLEKSAPISILLTPPSFEEDRQLGLPSFEDNIFARIIKNPSNQETRCTELLCGILRNVPTFRKLFVDWLREQSDSFLEGLDDLAWTIKTEWGIDNQKRIDLLLQGKDKDEIKISWPVEIKVGSGFHWSSRNSSSAEETDDQTERDFVRTGTDHGVIGEQDEKNK